MPTTTSRCFLFPAADYINFPYSPNNFDLLLLVRVQAALAGAKKQSKVAWCCNEPTRRGEAKAVGYRRIGKLARATTVVVKPAVDVG